MDKPPKPESKALTQPKTDGSAPLVLPPKPPLSPRPSKPPLPRAQQAPHARVKGLRILIIDDDPAKLDALAMSLRDLEAEVAVGSRVESGYGQAAKLMPDIVISDLVSPGERGWWLVQRLRRHPILRWTPFLLLRWWEETPSGEGNVLIDRVLDHLEEALGPIRVLKERIATGRPLSGRIDTTGPQALLRTLTASRISGVLTVNDAWSIFEATIGEGKLVSIVRRGMDGVVDDGEEALMQILLCDTAKWSFRTERKQNIPANIDSNLEKALGRAGKKIQDLFSQSRDQATPLQNLIRIRLDVLAAAAPSLSSIARRIAKAVGEGMSEGEIDVMLADVDDMFEIERAVHSLVRSGAIRVLEKPFDGDRSTEEKKAAAGAAYLMNEMSREKSEPSEHVESNRGISELTPAEDPISSPGQYKVTNLPIERLAATKRAVMRGPNAQDHNPEEKPKLSRYEEETLPGLPVNPNEPASVKKDAKPVSETPDEAKPGFLKKSFKDSLIPAPFSPAKRGDKQMWLAIALTLIFGALIVIGLVYLASGTTSEPPAPSGKL